MSKAGIELMGGAGALDAVTEYVADVLGWDLRCKLFKTLGNMWPDPEGIALRKDEETSEEVWPKWKLPQKLAQKIVKAVKMIK
jgi:hypothetical protein